MDIQNMMADVEEFYETAGFSDFYERVLKDLSEEQIIAMHNDIVKMQKNDRDYLEQ